MAVLTRAQREICLALGFPLDRIACLEDFVGIPDCQLVTIDEINHRFPDIPWNAIIASERSFTDYSFLFHATGHRLERDGYILSLIQKFVSFFDSLCTNSPSALVTSYGDNLFNLIACKYAEAKGIKLCIPQPSFLNEDGVTEGGYLANTSFGESFQMIQRYLQLKKRRLSSREINRAEKFCKSLIEYEGLNSLAYLYADKDYEKPITPQLKRFFTYLRMQHALDPSIYYYKIDPWRKFRANILRLWRFHQLSRFLQNQPQLPPDKTVFYAMHFQPEASTLVNGIWYANQIALIENISKAIPLGYTLIVKEHPRGRGMRPLWQYQCISDLHNVIISDAESKYLVRKAEMVVSISGSIGLEALALGKPVLMLGRPFHNYCGLYYQIKDISNLPKLFYNLLLKKNFHNQIQTKEDTYRFFISYLDGLEQFFPMGDGLSRMAPIILRCIENDYSDSIAWLNEMELQVVGKKINTF